MLVSLRQLISEIGVRNSKLIVLVARNEDALRDARTALAADLGLGSINVGLELARRLTTVPVDQRTFSASTILREFVGQFPASQPLVLDHLEVLFEPSLSLNPLDLLRRIADARPVVAIWPGKRSVDRLLYAEPTHPEHREFPASDVLIHEL